MATLPTAAIIGAGSSGIAAAKALHERGVPFTCLEASDRVGGNWVFGNKNGMSAAYRQLHINTSLEKEGPAGADRARRQGFALPVGAAAGRAEVTA